MSRILKSAVFVAIISSVAISPSWADPFGHHRARHGHHGGGYRHNALGWGLGLLAGTAVIAVATNHSRAYYHYPAVAAAPVYWPQPVIAPPVVVAPAPVYAQPQNYWYYCAQAGGYYPYVRSCPAGWMRVLPD
jgi:hypothetical protein